MWLRRRGIGLCATRLRGDATALHTDELRLVADATAARREEFATGRTCARSALLSVGVDARDVALLPDERGAVRWPAGTIGSITHTSGWVGAVAALRTGWGGVSSLGLDAEVARPLTQDALHVAASARERDALRLLEAGDAAVPWSAVLFAAKEATYKAAYPLIGEQVGHDAVHVTLSRTRFTGTVAASGRSPVRVEGGWAVGPGVVLALGVVRSGRRALPLARRAD